MTRCFSLAVLAAVLLAAPASAQITFTFDDFYGFAASGETISSTVRSTSVNDDIPAADRDRIDALVALRGANKTWDFTTIAYPDQQAVAQTYYLGADVAGLPGASNFPDANYAILSDTTTGGGTSGYVYARAGNNQYVTEGIYVAAQPATNNEEVVITYEPDGLQQLTFPLTFGTVTEDQTTQTVQGFTITTDYRSEAVGYGTLITPAGSFETLMIEYKVTVSAAGFGTTATTYAWATDDPLHSAAATSDAVPQGGRVRFASYSTPGGGGGTNNAPSIAGTVQATAVAGQPTQIDVLANVTDADGDDLTVTAVSDPANGTATIGDDGTGRRLRDVVVYTADAGFRGQDTFTFTVSDGTDTATGTVSVTVNPNTAAEGGPAALVLAVVPNPSSGAARVVVSTAGAADASVTVWDAVGREVARLWDGPLAAGDHRFALDGAALAPGVYLARVAVGGDVATVRLTVTR